MVASICHRGSSINCGHYVAKEVTLDKEVYVYDDEVVRIDEESSNKDEIYILGFQQKRLKT